MSTQFTNISSV